MTAPPRTARRERRKVSAVAVETPQQSSHRVPKTSGRTPRLTAAQRAYARRAQRKRQLPSARPFRFPALASRTSFVVLVMGLLAAGVLASLFLSTWAVRDSYLLEDARNKSVDLSSSVEQLKQDVAALESPGSLESRARQLGMVPAPDPVILTQSPDGSVNRIGTPTAATAPPAAPPPAPVAPPPVTSTPAPPTSSAAPPSTPVTSTPAPSSSASPTSQTVSPQVQPSGAPR